MASEDRRTVILETALSRLADAGMDGLSHRAIDRKAGLPLGTTSNYFSKKNDLILASADHLCDLLGKDCDDLQVSFSETVAAHGLDAGIAHVGNELTAYVEDHRHLFLARLELTLAATRNPALGDIGTQLATAAQRPIAFFLRLIAENPNSETIAISAAFIDALSLNYATGQSPRPDPAQLKNILKSIL